MALACDLFQALANAKGRHLVNPLVDIDRQPNVLQSLQLLLALVFLISYLVAVGGMFGARGRLRAAGVAAVAAIGFCALIQPWTVGVMWGALAVGCVGLFVIVSFALSGMLGVARTVRPAEATTIVATAPAAPLPREGKPLRPREAAATVL